MKIFLVLAACLAGSHAEAKTAKTTTLWKEWYVYSVAGVPQGYFVETAELRPKDKQIAVSQEWFEAEGGGTKTFIGSVAKDDARLTPVAFFSERSGPERSYKIDGRVKGANLEMTFKPVNPQGANIKKTIKLEKDMLLSNFLPLRISRTKPGAEPLKFKAVVEDARDGNFDARDGSAEQQGVTKQIRGNTCRKTIVAFGGSEDAWWITSEGKLCEIYLSANQSRLLLSSEEEAKAALKKP